VYDIKSVMCDFDYYVKVYPKVATFSHKKVATTRVRAVQNCLLYVSCVPPPSLKMSLKINQTKLNTPFEVNFEIDQIIGVIIGQ